MNRLNLTSLASMSAQQRAILKYAGYALLAIVTFFFALAYTFPYERLKDKIIEGLSEKYDVSIASIEPNFVPGTFTIKTMMLQTRPESPDGKVATIVLDEVEVDVGVLSAIFWTVDMARLGVEVDAKVGMGQAHIAMEHDKGDSSLFVDVETEMLPLASLPGVSEAVGLPMAGGLNADFAIELPKGDWSKADGHLKLTCVGCTVGDGVAKMKMKPNPNAPGAARRATVFASEGLTVPRLSLGAALAEIEIEEGIGTIKTLAATSKDGFLKIEGKIEFKKPFSESTFPGCMTFKLSDELKEREKNFGGVDAMLPGKARQDDGSYAIPTRGKLTALGWDVRRQCGEAEPSPRADRSRPRISSKPTIDTRAGSEGEGLVQASPPPEGEAAAAAQKIDAGPVATEPTPGGPELTKDKDPLREESEQSEEGAAVPSDGRNEGSEEEQGPELRNEEGGEAPQEVVESEPPQPEVE